MWWAFWDRFKLRLPGTFDKELPGELRMATSQIGGIWLEFYCLWTDSSCAATRPVLPTIVLPRK